MGTGHERKGRCERGTRIRKTKANPKAERGHGIVRFNDFAESVVECRTAFELLERPLFECHERRFGGVVTPYPAKPEIHLPVAPERLLSPRKIEREWDGRSRLAIAPSAGLSLTPERSRLAIAPSAGLSLAPDRNRMIANGAHQSEPLLFTRAQKTEKGRLDR